MTMAEQLLQLANQLIWTPSVAQHAARRRAVSTAYYAVFHAIADLCTEVVLPQAEKTDNSREYERVYRALDHGSLKREFSQPPLKDHTLIKDIGALVVWLQSERHMADYRPPHWDYSSDEAVRLVKSAYLAVAMLSGLDAATRKTLAIALLFKNRSQ